MKTSFSLLILLLLAISTATTAQNNYTWERAYARPFGAVLVAEIMENPQLFLLDNKGATIKVAGKFLSANLSYDAESATAEIVWGARLKGVSCVTYDNAQMRQFVDITKGSQLIATGTVSELYDNWLYLEDCSIEEDVTLFHSRNPRLILGNWCGFFRQQLSRRLEFVRNKQGRYSRKIFSFENGKWKPWPTNPAQVSVARKPAHLVTYNIDSRGKKYSGKKYHIVDENTLVNKSDSHTYYRCK